MKKKIFSMVAVALLSVAGASALTGTTSANASVGHTTPAKMRGTWYSYDAYSNKFTKIKITKHTFTYAGQKIKKLEVQKFKVGGKMAYNFKQRKSTSASSFYQLGKAKVKGKYKKCLVADSSRDSVFFKSKVKHFSSLKY